MKKNKGITLIALVITIIIMLILVSITVATTLNDGTIGKAKEAKEETKSMQFRESFLSWKSSHEVEEQVYFNGDETEYEDDELNQLSQTLTIYVDDGTITENQKEQLLAGETIFVNGEAYSIRKEIDFTKFYGKIVKNYGSPDQVWRIFYIDTDNYFGEGKNTIYLKADYTNDDDGYFLDDNCYTSETIYKDENVGKTKMATLNPLWASEKGTLTRGDEKFSTYLCDPVTSENYNSTGLYWKSYFDSNNASYINYVIGSPTIELYLRSYNDVHSNNRIEYKYTNPGGYTFLEPGKSSYTTVAYSIDYAGFDGMYCGRNGELESLDDYMCCWWIASPTPYGPGNVTLQVDCAEAYIGNWYNGDKGQISPIVSLKSNFKFKLAE